MKTFRLLSYLLVVALSFSFVSCSDDDNDDDPDYSVSIVGRWELTYAKYDWNFGDGKKQEEGAESGFFRIFESNGKCYSYEPDYETEEEAKKYYYSWTIKDDKLTRKSSFEDNTVTETIVELTDNKLVIDWYEDLGNGQYDHSVETYTRKK
ncbi:lipocalin family protein [Bacteroides sp. 51]|uniref:lipocalin family protein n=1 Tax=Bacteroides sp. 51 TaxID=2302938 RepID=UPI0013D76D27|nr:lipocalin family protein [Bacteroides sp. 51]NDV83541.1 hypothetical protein [Bacteroides sp. 51]